ncbi:MAG: FecR domain-containing protein [Rubrivivax sp.]|nr:FecR domain-containing protein [Rubrivivax sp.]
MPSPGPAAAPRAPVLLPAAHAAAALSAWLLPALLLTLPPSNAHAQPLPGRVVQVLGEARVGDAPAVVGMPAAGALLSTGANGFLQLRLDDGSVIALPPASRLRLPADATRNVALEAGGLRLSPALAPGDGAPAVWRVDLGQRSIRTNGFLTLQDCAAGCALPSGLYGRIAQGEAVLDYQGGRSVLRGRSFRWTAADARPEPLAQAPALLEDGSHRAAAAQVRAEAAQTLKAGIEAFAAGDDAAATRALEAVRAVVPGEPLVPYYLGLIALKRENHEAASRLLQQYAREDPEGAAAREVPRMLTLLTSSQLQQEVATAVAREREVAATPPEPGSIAVQAFVNRGSDDYRAMAKGLAAMVIADLSRVPGLKVLEREKVQLLLDEMKLGDSGLADTTSAVRSGRLMRAEKVVVGNFEVQ